MKMAMRIGLSAAAVVVCVAGAAFGQNALGDGTILDRNLQVGSGGRNTRARDYESQIRFSNAIVTGNVAGRSFHGNLGYRPTDDFGAALGSNQLYTFRRDSALSAAPLTGVRASEALRYQFALSTGEALPSAVAGALGVVQRSGADGGTPVRSTTSSALRSTADFLTAQGQRPTLVGYRSDDSGRVYTATASPLLGVAWYPLQEPPGLREELLRAAPEADRGARRPGGLTGLETTAPGLPSPLDLAGMGRARGLETEPKALRPGAAAARSDTYDRVLDAFRDTHERLTGREETREPAGLDDEAEAPWRRDLDQLRRALRGEEQPARPELEPEPRRPLPTPPAPAPAPEEAARPDRPSGIPGLDPRELLIQPDAPRKRTGEVLSPRMVEILRSSGVRIDTLRPATTRADRQAYTTHMQTGQQLLAEGRFFDAEDRFTRAMSALPGDPMAAVGRLHAQLGAGLYLSAGANLRSLLRAHPELAAARFNIALVPSDERSVKIAEQLRQEIAQGSVRIGREAGLLLAYLGRLRDDRSMRVEGLTSWQNRIGADDEAELALHELLSRVWEER